MPRILSHVENDITVNLVVGNNLLDEVGVHKYRCCIWDVILRNPNGESGVHTVYGIHNATSSTDATIGKSGYDIVGGAVTSEIVDQVDLGVALSGTGVDQKLQLVAIVSSGTWVASIHRRPLVGPAI